jgi:muconolactone delta-isomerase
MEYLVALTPEAAEEIRADHHLLRLWSSQPGRVLAIFNAPTANALPTMRAEYVTTLKPHANDRGLGAAPGDLPEYFTTFSAQIPADAANVKETLAAEARRAAELAASGVLVRLWRLPGMGRALGLWRAADDTSLQAVLSSLPMYPWLDTEITVLEPHPGDPGRTISKAVAA